MRSHSSERCFLKIQSTIQYFWDYPLKSRRQSVCHIILLISIFSGCKVKYLKKSKLYKDNILWLEVADPNGKSRYSPVVILDFIIEKMKILNLNWTDIFDFEFKSWEFAEHLKKVFSGSKYNWSLEEISIFASFFRCDLRNLIKIQNDMLVSNDCDESGLVYINSFKNNIKNIGFEEIFC